MAKTKTTKTDHVHDHVNVHVNVYVNVYVDVLVNVDGSCHANILSRKARIISLVVRIDPLFRDFGVIPCPL